MVDFIGRGLLVLFVNLFSVFSFGVVAFVSEYWSHCFGSCCLVVIDLLFSLHQ